MFGVYAPMAYKLRFNPQKPRPKSLGFFLGPVPVYYICPPSSLGPGGVDDIFGVEANTLV